MSVEIYGYLANAVLIGSTLLAIACVVLGVRKRELSRRLAWMCAGNAMMVVVVAIAGYLMAMAHAFGAVAEVDAAEKATRLARGISEAMNCAAFFAIAVLPPGLAALILFARAPRDAAKAPPG